MASRLRLVAMLLLVLMGVGLGAIGLFKCLAYPSVKYAEQVAAARRLSSDVRRFEDLFPSARSRISHSTGEMGPTSWWSELSNAEIEINATATLDVDPKTLSIKQVGQVRVLVMWIGSSEQLPSGSRRIHYTANKWFSMDELEELLHAEPTEAARVSLVAARKPPPE